MTKITTTLAGLQFYDLRSLRQALQQGTPLRAQRDPDNLADRNAVSIWLDRGVAARCELLDLIDDGVRDRLCWQLGHIERGLARHLAPLLDAGQGLDVFFHSGCRAGAWSVEVRLEGAAAEAAAAKRMAERERARLVEELRDAAYTEERHLEEAARVLAERFPGCSWDLVPAMLPVVITDGDPRIEYRRGLLDCRMHRQLSKRPWLGPQEFRLEDVEENGHIQHRRAEATEVFAPIVDEWVRTEEARRERRRATNAARRDEQRLHEVANILATAAAAGEVPCFRPRHRDHLPAEWLRRHQVEQLGLRPQHCRIVAAIGTDYGTTLYFYAAQVDERRVAEHRGRRGLQARKRQMRARREKIDESEVPF